MWRKVRDSTARPERIGLLMARRPTQNLRVTEVALQRIVAQLDAEAKSSPETNARKSQRYSYQAKSVQITFPDGDVLATEAVPCRNLSRDGIGFLMGRFLYPGTACSVRLVSEFNYVTMANGRVVRCRYISGTVGVHEVGVSFNAPIDIAMFHRGAISLRVLLVDDNAAQERLLRRILKPFTSEFVSLPDPDLALETALFKPFELVLVTMDGQSFKGCEFVEQLRARGYVRPITTLTTLLSEELDTHCQQAGCTCCSPVPLTQAGLRHLIDTMRSEPIVSSLAHDPEMATTINEFVGGLQEQVTLLERAWLKGEHTQIVTMARQLRVFSENCGFELIGEVAKELIESLKRESDPNECRPLMSRLVRYCLAARPASLTVTDTSP